jgi:2-keto-4-pentenoate hydratase/2-oxohepta-3-ene-1,7-dioic acid hydratase in catechol pathway
MKLVSTRQGDHTEAGLLLEGEVLALGRTDAACEEIAGLPATVIGLLQAGETAISQLRKVASRLESDTGLKEQLRRSGTLVALDSVSLATPIPVPGTLFAAGMNYRDHLAEMKTPVPGEPFVFLKGVSSIAGPADDIVRPKGHDAMVDWEGELAVVIGKECHKVSEDDALDCVAGYMVSNDVSARDWVAAVQATPGIFEPITNWDRNVLGKGFPTFCPLGPALVTADEIPDPQNLKLETRVNGETVQSSNTANMVFPVARLIAHLAYWLVLRPGDVILTGTPAGVGVGRNPKRFLQPGEVVEVEIEGIGTITNPVV